jgi:hypothetical protein
MYPNGWWGLSDRSFDGTTNDLDMRSLLRCFGHVHQIAPPAAVDERTRWFSTLGTRLDDPNQLSTSLTRRALNGRNNAVAWRSPRNEDTHAIFEAPDTCSTGGQRIDEYDFLFSFARRTGCARMSGWTSGSRSLDHRRNNVEQNVATCLVPTRFSGMVLRAKRFAKPNRGHFMDTR